MQISHLDGLHGYLDGIVKQSHSHGCDNGQPLIDMKNLCEQLYDEYEECKRSYLKSCAHGCHVDKSKRVDWPPASRLVDKS